ncbi:TetR family transcriptional regulator [Streptomyces tendae]|uniref:TetR/AcrR family transcriptional regulator n=1 Tax=Streptomyces tendae TaxID=1932 RepID=UPI001677D77E|nr:TetR/AcrR family transcriptional regulator [Streptomyces tendae]GHB11081.1 TetR family transcriptional regulator [Streptomyces tendae]
MAARTDTDADTDAEPEEGPTTLRHRIVVAAAGLLEENGLDAMSTRAVAARAGVPPPTIFRVFGDKDGLLEAVGEYGFETYLRAKSRLPRSEDPVRDLRDAWDLHVRFGLEQPAYYTLVYGLPRPGHLSRAGREAVTELQGMITRVAAAGRLRMSVERAAAVVHAAGMGTILTLISTPAELRDPAAADVTRDLVVAAVTTPPPDGPAPGAGRDTAGAAMALRAVMSREETPALRPAERLLLLDWLNRMADTRPSAPDGG